MLMADVLTKLIRQSSLLAPDASAFKRQESIFIVLNLFVLAALLLIHTLFSSFLGRPPRTLMIVLAAAFLINVVELIWLQGAGGLTLNRMVMLTWFAIGLNMVLAFGLASLSYRQDAQYFILLLSPILQAAFRFSLLATALVITVCAALDLFWVWNYFRLHPPVQINEYLEAGTIALIYAIVGFLVWTLADQLRTREATLEASLVSLERTRERLLVEEKLAAVGRFSSSIAHEIRNPVAMISSALSTASNTGLSPAERTEMLQIASTEATRLERLTDDFLAYARPRKPALEPSNLADSLGYIVDLCRPHAREKQISIESEVEDPLPATLDAGQIQQALLNLIRNAVEASAPSGVVRVRGSRQEERIHIEVGNSNGPIPAAVSDRIFEPFFTTKPTGTGLGLAIARGIVHSHGGDLLLSRNEPHDVRFSITLPHQPQELL